MSAQVGAAMDRLLDGKFTIVALSLALGGVLPDDQGGGAVLWPERCVMASQLAPRCHDASCTLVVNLSSATRRSLLAGHPKPIRACCSPRSRHGRQAAAGYGC